MVCFLCKRTKEFYQRLHGSRLRYMRKGFPKFADNDYLCLKCFQKFDKIYLDKRKTRCRTSLALTTGSNVSLATTSSKSDSTSTRNVVLDESPPFQFNTAGFYSNSSEASDAENIAPPRNSTISHTSPLVSPAPTDNRPPGRAVAFNLRSRTLSSRVESDSVESPIRAPQNDLANVGPVVKKRTAPVVYLNQNIMDIYLANTSGG